MNDYGKQTEIQVPTSRVRRGEEEALTDGDSNRDEWFQGDCSPIGYKRLETRGGDSSRQYNVTKRSQRRTTAGGILYRLIRDAENRLAQLQAEILRVQETLEEYRYLEEELERKVEENPRNPDAHESNEADNSQQQPE